MDMNYTCDYDSPLGKILLACDETALTGLWFYGQKFFAENLEAEHEPSENRLVFTTTKRWLDMYFAGKVPDSFIPFHLTGTEFQIKVWQELLRIPRGQTRTYKDIAQAINCNSSRAIGSAVAHNNISIIVPCHRVIGSDGKLTGYSAGIDTKIKLLSLEGVDVSRWEKSK